MLSLPRYILGDVTARLRARFSVLAVGLMLVSTAATASGYPSPAAADTVAAGAALFATSGCTQCHGPSGDGTAKGPSLHDLRKRLKPEATRRQIHDGGSNMPPFGDALTDDQINSLVDFLQSKNGWKLIAK